MSTEKAHWRSLVRQGRTPEEIAGVAGVSPRTVYRACKGMDIKLVHEFAESGVSTAYAVQTLSAIHKPSEIARILGVSVQYVNKHI